jgi:hypothetical protein
MKTAPVIILFLLFVLSLPALLRKRTAPLVSVGKVVAVGHRPFVMPWNENQFGVYAGKTKLFSLWGDASDSPLFIFPFADRKRFLCIDDDDTSVLVFVVDFSSTGTNTSGPFGWPPNDYLRDYIARRCTNVVMDTKACVRLPSFPEVEEVSSNIAALSPSQLGAESFPFWDLGVYRGYWPKKVLLSALATNRQSVWP